MKYWRFKTFEEKSKIIMKVLCALIIVETILLISKSYAVYQQEIEVPFIRARVGKFKTNDIQLAMLLDGEEVSTPPSKDNYTVDISCDNADGSWDSDRWGANIDNIRAGKVKCEVNFSTPAPTLSDIIATSEKTSINLSYTSGGIETTTTCKYGTVEGEYSNTIEGATNTNCNITGLEPNTIYYYQVCVKNPGGEDCKEGFKQTNTIADKVKLGDYIIMTPTNTNYNIPKEWTGYKNDQTVNPSRLSLWRIIKINPDGGVEMISSNYTSEKIFFEGKQGYLWFIFTLNKISSAYADNHQVEYSRHFGYSDQMSACYYLPHEMTGACNPDSGYEVDKRLVEEALGKEGLTDPCKYGAGYWVASRSYYDGKVGHHQYSVRRMTDTGLNASMLFDVYDNGVNHTSMSGGYGVRPILALKSTTEISSGNGTSTNPYSLS